MMICGFTFISTLFNSYQDYERGDNGRLSVMTTYSCELNSASSMIRTKDLVVLTSKPRADTSR